MKKSCWLLSTPLFLVAGPAFAQGLVLSDPSGNTATFYGQFSPTYLSVDDGRATYGKLVDNNNSNSRVGVWLDYPMGEGLLRFNFQTSLGLRNTAHVNQIEDGDWIDWQRGSIQKLEFAYASDFGTFWLGQGSMATDGAAELDNSGTSFVSYAYGPDVAGGFLFRRGAELSDKSVADVFDDLDGGWRFRARYDTPTISGFSFSAAYGEEILDEDNNATYYDAAIRYGLNNDVYTFDAALGYGWIDDEGTTEQLIASASGLHKPSGVNLTMSAGNNQGEDGSFYYAKLGWKGDLTSYGSTALSVDYYDGSDFAIAGSSSRFWGLQAVQSFSEINLEAYLGYRVFSYEDDAPESYSDLEALMLGARWKF